MARTFTSLKAEALADDFDSATYGSQVETWINDALKDMARRLRLPARSESAYLEPLAGSATVAVPNRLVRIDAIVDTETNTTLDPVDTEQIEQWPDSSGVPSCYAVNADLITLYPTPQQASTTRYLIRFYGLPADISGTDAITATIPDDYGHAVVCFVRSRLFAFGDDPEMVAFWKAEYEDALRKLRSDVNRRSPAKRQIQGGFRRRRWPRFTLP